MCAPGDQLNLFSCVRSQDAQQDTGSSAFASQLSDARERTKVRTRHHSQSIITLRLSCADLLQATQASYKRTCAHTNPQAAGVLLCVRSYRRAVRGPPNVATLSSKSVSTATARRPRTRLIEASNLDDTFEAIHKLAYLLAAYWQPSSRRFAASRRCALLCPRPPGCVAALGAPAFVWTRQSPLLLYTNQTADASHVRGHEASEIASSSASRTHQTRACLPVPQPANEKKPECNTRVCGPIFRTEVQGTCCAARVRTRRVRLTNCQCTP